MSTNLVTGDNLNEILTATKKYIDVDLFEDVDMEGLGDLNLGLRIDGIEDTEVDNIINKHFK